MTKYRKNSRRGRGRGRTQRRGRGRGRTQRRERGRGRTTQRGGDDYENGYEQVQRFGDAPDATIIVE